MKGINATNTPTGLDQIPLVPGFDLGVIGDMILHKGKSYLTLGSLGLCAADRWKQHDCPQSEDHYRRIIRTRRSSSGTIFRLRDLSCRRSDKASRRPANIEYRDIGVSLSITPRLGEGDVITLNLNEEITESLDNDLMQ